MVRRLGPNALGIDHAVSKRLKAPVIRLDLVSPAGRELLWRILKQDTVCRIHLAPPCGTASRAREIRRKKGPSPKPLRSERYPDGFPWLRGLAQSKLQAANQLYLLTSQVMAFACQTGIVCTIENPARSHAGATSFLNHHIRMNDDRLHHVTFHHCMYGSHRRKATRLTANHTAFCVLERACDGTHEHEPWGLHPSGQWSTHLEVEYPTPLCSAMAQVFAQILCKCGITPTPSSLLQAVDVVPPMRAAAAATGRQPTGHKLSQLVPEYKSVHRLRAPSVSCLRSLPAKLTTTWQVPPEVHISPHLPALPSGTRVLRALFSGDMMAASTSTSELEPEQIEDNLNDHITIGIPWSPSEFLQQAISTGHPKHFLRSIPRQLARVLDRMQEKGEADIARDRTQQMRRWILRATELSDLETSAKAEMSEHVREILQNKRIKLFEEMLEEAGSSDVSLAQDISEGFDLMGPIKTNPCFPLKTSFATLTEDQVRSNAAVARECTLASVAKHRDPETELELVNITEEEVKRGWLRGPVEVQSLPKTAVVSRRFGVKQNSIGEGGAPIVKVRPIDDLTESLVNLTNSASHTISPMSVDTIAAGILRRMHICGGSRLTSKTIDLRKAYKNLPLSKAALNDSYIVLFDPSKNKPVAYQSLVLPFGARAAVMGFCRTSYGIWEIGCSLLGIHWSVYFDDYFVVTSEQESRHVDLALQTLFSLLGWETSGEKDAGFDTVSRVLGVMVDLTDSSDNLVRVTNTESRIKELVASMNQLIDKSRFRPGELRVLRGRLQFAENQLFGRAAGKRLKTLSRHAEMLGSGTVDSELTEALIYLRDRVILGPPRLLRAGTGQQFFLFTDASYEQGEVGLGGVLFDGFGNIVSWFGENLSDLDAVVLNPLEKETIIYECEALAFLLGIMHLLGQKELSPLTEVVGFLDNQAALQAFLTGRTHSRIVEVILREFDAFEVATGLTTWVDRVASAANPADEPSRSIHDSLPLELRVPLNREDILQRFDVLAS